jgi:MFS transporter, DHA2 family, multidrug resistance protein
MSLLGPTMIDLPRGPDGKVQGAPPISWRLAIGLFGAVLGSFISNLDTRLTTFSLQDLRGGIGYGVDEAAWVSAAYNIAEIAVVPVTAWLAAIISQRRAVALAVSLLTLAGALCPWAATQGYVLLVGMRFLQGLGGGALIPLLLGILLRFMPLHQRIYGFAVYALVTASTPLVSESLAGVLTDVYGWQSIFYIGAALGPVVMGFILFGLPVESAKPEMFRQADYPGMLLMILWPSLLTAALSQGQRLDWFSSPLIVSLFVASACCLAAFVVTELSQEAPLINLRLLGRLNFSGGLLTIVAFSFATLMTSTILPQFGTQVRGFRELQVGNILVWAALAQVVVCAMAPMLVRQLDVRLMLALGLLIATLGARLATYIDSDWVAVDILPSHLIQASGQPLIMVPLIVIATSTLQVTDAVAGSTIFNVVRSLAGTFGGAVVGAILTVRERVHSNTMVDHLVAGAPATVHAQAMSGLVAAVRRQATTMAAADAYGWIGVITLGAMLITLVLKDTKLFRAPPTGPAG